MVLKAESVYVPRDGAIWSSGGSIVVVTSLCLVFTTAGTGEQSRLEVLCGGCYVECADA